MTHPIHKIKDFCQVGDGAHASIKRGNTGIMYLSSKNFKPHGLDLTNLDYISQSDYEKHFKVSKSAITTPSANDVLLGIIGSIGVPYIVKAGDLFGISSSVAILRTQQGLDTNYLFHYMRSSFFQQSVEAIKSGAAQGFLSLEMIRNLPLIAPEEGLQQQIADILTAYDDLIETNNQRIVTLEAIAQQIYKEWFVRLRFPNWEHTPFHHGIPDGWEVKSIGEICSKVTDGSHFSPAFVPEGKPMASVKDMQSYGFSLDSIKTISEQDFDNLKNSDCLPKIGDVLIAKDGSYLKHIFVWNTDIEIVILSSIAILRPHIGESSYYLALTLKQDSIKSMMSCYVSGAALPRIILDAFKKMKILMPDSILLSKFDIVIQPIFDQIKTLIEQNENLTKTRNLLLPRLISGKLTLKQAIQQTDNIPLRDVICESVN